MQFTFLYVALIYLVAVALWRRFGTELPWRYALFFYLLVLLFLFKPLTQPFVNVPADYLARLFPWRALPSDLQNRNPEINDVILQMVPWAHQVRTYWMHGEAPLWNFATGGGYPLLANGQSAALSPFRLLALPLDLGSSLTCEAALKLLCALTFTFLYMRRRFSAAASVISAVSFGFSTFIVVWLYFPHSSVVALLPALFLALDFVLDQQNAKRVIFLGGVLAVMLLCGHPESVAHSVLAGGAYVLFRLVAERVRVRQRVVALGVAGALALMLALPFILPFLESMPRSQRYQWLHDSAGKSMARTHVRSVIPMLHPEFYGLVKDENVWGPGDAESVCGYGGVLGWIGWGALLVTLLRRRSLGWHEAFFLAALPFFIAVALGWYGFGDAFAHLPLFSLAANSRLRLVVCWVIAVLAGMAVDRMRKDRRALLIGAALVVTALAAAFLLQESSDWLHVRDALLSFIPRAVVIVAALLAASMLPWRSAAFLLLVAVTFDLWSFGARWNPVVEAAQLYPSTPLIRFLQQRIHRSSEDGLVRVAGTTGMFFPNSAALYGLEDVRAHDPMANGRFLGVMRVLSGYTSGDYFGMLTKPTTPYLGFLNVRYMLTSAHETLPPPFRLIYSARDGRVFENPRVLPRFYAPGNVRVEFDTNRRFAEMLRDQDFAHVAYLERLPTWIGRNVQEELARPGVSSAPRAVVSSLRRTARGYTMIVDASRWSYVASSQTDFPGWKLFRNGRREKVIDGNECFIGFLVPPGRSMIEVEYRPLSFVAGSVASIATALGAVIVLLAGPLRRRRNSRDTQGSRNSSPGPG